MARRRCRQYAIRAVRIAPKTAPGKKPARMPSVVKSGQLDGATDLSARALGEGVCSVLETGVIVVPVVLVGEAAVVCVEDVDAEVNAQTSPWHSYPNGQHEPPQRGSSSSSLVVCTWFCGCSVLFCCCTSHEIVWIYAQFSPFGQQMTELASSRSIHSADDGQQNASSEPLHCL